MSFFQMLRYLVFNLTLRLGICLPLKGTHIQTLSGVTEEKINELKDTVIETVWNEAQRKKKKINEYINSEMWDYFKRSI